MKKKKETILDLKKKMSKFSLHLWAHIIIKEKKPKGENLQTFSLKSRITFLSFLTYY